MNSGKKFFNEHLKVYFEELSQVVFIKNMYWGIAFLIISIFFSSDLFLCGFFASLIGYFYSKLYSTPKILKNTGSLTINGFFFGIAMASLFQKSPQFYACLVIGALAIPFVAKAAFEVLQHWKLNPLIIPYILVTWVFYLSAHALSLKFQIEGLPLSHFDFIPGSLAHANTAIQILFSIFTSMGRVFFLPSPSYGLAVFLLIFLFSVRNGIYFFGATALATMALFLLSGNTAFHSQYGLFAFSSGLVGLGLASLPEKFKLKTVFLFSLFSLFLTMALEQFLSILHLPILSLPYVLVFWIALLSRAPRLNVSWTPSVSP
jgi:urea transporter